MKFVRPELISKGFVGFVTVKDLNDRQINVVPQGPGSYVVLRELDAMPAFLENNPGGWFKGKDPTVSQDKLVSNWVNGTHTIYIGKGNNLQIRLSQFLCFGAGMPIGHWGGRLVWQIADSSNFLVAWKISAI